MSFTLRKNSAGWGALTSSQTKTITSDKEKPIIDPWPVAERELGAMDD